MDKLNRLISRISEEIYRLDEKDVDIKIAKTIAKTIVGDGIKEIINECDFKSCIELLDKKPERKRYIKSLFNPYDSKKKRIYETTLDIMRNEMYIFSRDIIDNIELRMLNELKKYCDLRYSVERTGMTNRELNEMFIDVIKCKESENSEKIEYKRVYELTRYLMNSSKRINVVEYMLENTLEENKDNYKKELFQEIVNNKNIFKELFCGNLSAAYFEYENEEKLKFKLGTRNVTGLKFSVNDLKYMYEKYGDILLCEEEDWFFTNSLTYYSVANKKDRERYINKVIENDDIYELYNLRMYKNCSNYIEAEDDTELDGILEACIIMHRIGMR